MLFDLFLNVLEALMIGLFLKSFSERSDFRVWLITAVYTVLSFGYVTAFNNYGWNEALMPFLDVALSYLMLSLITEKNVLAKLVIACLPNIIISSVSIPVTILLSVLLYHSIDYASLAQNHYYLLAAVTMPARALVFWFVSVRIRHMKMILKDLKRLRKKLKKRSMKALKILLKISSIILKVVILRKLQQRTFAVMRISKSSTRNFI